MAGIIKHIFQKTISDSRCRAFILFHQFDFDAFQPESKGLTSCCRPVLYIWKPSIILNMYPIVYIIILRDFPGQTDPDGFQTKCSCLGSGQLSVPFPALPADILYMGLIFNASFIIAF